MRYTVITLGKKGSYAILLDGQHQITGAIFCNRDGLEDKRVMDRAVVRLNKALANGLAVVTLNTPHGRYRTFDWDLVRHNHGKEIPRP